MCKWLFRANGFAERLFSLLMVKVFNHTLETGNISIVIILLTLQTNYYN